MKEEKMKLTLAERVNLMGILPKQGNFVTLQTLRKLQEDLSVSDKEIKKYDVKIIPTGNGNANYRWNEEGTKYEKELIFSDLAFSLIKAKLEVLDKQEQLTDGHFTLYEKFVENKKE